jgi:lysozyme family protein
MADFKTVFPKVLRNEGANRLNGGYQDAPEDNGNWTGGHQGVGHLIGTKYGITAPELCKLLGRIATVDDMKALTLDQALTIYKPKYWDVVRADEIKSDDLAYEIVDMAVNAGPGACVKLACMITGIQPCTHMTDEIINKLNLKS